MARLVSLAVTTFIAFAINAVLARPNRSKCIVKALGDEQNDVPNILARFRKVLERQLDCKYNPRAHEDSPPHNCFLARADDYVQFSDDLDYWRDNSYPIAFQNHAASFVITGSDIHIDGYGTGGINGNGDLWYSDEAGTTQPGRPMPFVFWNVTNVRVQNFFVHQPPLWGINTMNGTDMYFKNIDMSAVSSEAPSGSNWVHNTNGFDTMDARNITLDGFTYRGGDDCIAIKPRSYDIFLNNITCNSGNGIAIGCLGQYQEDSSVENVTMQNLAVPSTRYGIYIKIWMGELVDQEDDYESCCEPRGGGWGNVRNVTFKNVDVTDALHPASMDQNGGDNDGGDYAGTSKIEISEIYFSSFTGVLGSSSNKVTISCSEVYPCHDIYFEDMDQQSSDGESMTGRCEWQAEGGIDGLANC